MSDKFTAKEATALTQKALAKRRERELRRKTESVVLGRMHPLFSGAVADVERCIRASAEEGASLVNLNIDGLLEDELKMAVLDEFAVERGFRVELLGSMLCLTWPKGEPT